MTRRTSDDDAAARDGPRRSSLGGEPLPPAFFDRDVVTVARALLGCFLVHDTADGVLAGRIVETEAYNGRSDAASHAWRGERPRLRHLFGPPGTIYVYRSYGLHWCVNAVTAPERHGAAVLLRAVEPVDGLATMRRHRRGAPDRQLTNGPGKLCEAFGIVGAHDGGHWSVGPLRLHAGAVIDARGIDATPRIGITRNAEALLRFTVRGAAGLSRRA